MNIYNNTIKVNSNDLCDVKLSNQSLVDSALELYNEINGSYWDLNSIRRIFIKTYVSDCFAKDNPSNCDTGNVTRGPVLKKTRKFYFI